MEILPALVISSLLFGVAAMLVMQNKGRSGLSGFTLGFLLGPLGLIIALAMERDDEMLEWMRGDRRRCPHCAESIRSEASLCRFCGNEVRPREPF